MSLAYYRAQDRELVRRGRRFRGTPARRFADIKNYFTHAAFHRLEGLPVPRALGRPGIADHAWFATRSSAAAISRRHDGYATEALFDRIMTTFPLAEVVASGRLVTDGVVDVARGPKLPFSVMAKEKTVVARIAEDTGDAVSGTPRVWVEHCLYACVRIAAEVVGAAIFQRDTGSDLYRLALIGRRYGEADGVEGRRRRLAILAFSRFNDAIRLWPGVSFDFIGAAEPAAAAMGYSLFRRLRRDEMRRLKQLPPAHYTAERRRVTAYRYPTFMPEEVVTPARALRAMLREAPGWSLNCCRSAYRASREAAGGRT